MTTASDAPDSAEITAQDDLAVRKSLGPYELKRKLGQGGMGAVYLAVDPLKKEQLALKILPREKASNPQLVKRFKAEAQNSGQLTHENIVGVFGTGESDGYLYIALEFVDGIDVHDLIQKRGVLPVKRSIDIIKQVTRALQHAYEQHIVHRDIKPANLLVRRDGVVKLADMGLARAVDESIETGITRAGTTVGTVDYMSPEQARNSKAADVRSDIYSLGCTWYHMLTGRPPFAEGSLTNKLHAHAKQPPPDPRAVNANVPEGVVAVIQRMMAKDPDSRYQTPAELIKDLEGALVNKDAVSRQILEGIVDDFPESEPSSEHSVPTSATGRIHSSITAPSSHTEDEYEIYAVSPPAPGVEKPVETGTPVDEIYKPSKAASASPAKPGVAPVKGVAPAPAPSRKPLEESDQSIVTSRPGTVPPKPSKSTKHQAEESVRAIDVTTRNATSAVVSTPARSTKADKGNAHTGPAHSLPPPRRKSENNEPITPSIPLSPKKLATIFGGISAVLLLLFILFPWIKRTLMGEDPLVVAINPFEGPPAPPAPMTGVPAGDVPAPADVQNSVPGQPTVKDVLTDRKDILGNSLPLGPGGKSGTRPGPGIELVGPENRNSAIAEWMDQALQTTASPIFNIRKGQAVDAERQYPFLQDAIKNVARDGGRLVLYHEGPFDLDPTELTGGVVSIEAAPGIRPRIRLVKDNENNKPPGIRITGGSLLLDGVDIVCDANSVPPDRPWVWFHVVDGHIYVKRSSLTLTGQRKGTTIAFKLSGKPNGTVSNSRFLLDESLIRGDGFEAAQLESAALDAVIRNSLVISGDAPSVVIRHNQKVVSDSARKLRLVGSTISTRQQALTLNSTDVAAPIPMEIVLEETLLAAPEHASHSALLRLEDWPQTKPRVGDAGPFKSLNWAAHGSAALGFSSLISSNTDSSLVIHDGIDWKQLWKEATGVTFSSVGWPQDLKTPMAETELKQWSPKTLETLQVAFTSLDHIPGCRVSNLRVPDSAGSEKGLAQQNQRPRVPVPFASKLVQNVDLARTDLGKLIASQKWDDGTVFIASGSGTKICSPILIEGRKIRIKFVQTEGAALVITPKGGPRSGDHAAFITVRGGQLDLEHGSFDYDSKESPSIAAWFMNVEGGSFSLLNCRIKAPVAAAARSRGLIRWVAGALTAKTDGEFSAFGQIADSLLVGNGTLISLELSNMAFVVRNTAFIARQQLFEISSVPLVNSAASVIDAQGCTYLVAGTQFVVHAPPPADGMKSHPIRMFHQDCIFATLTPDAAGKTGPLLMNLIGGGSATTSVAWNEEGCGYGMDLKAFFLASPMVSSGTVPPQDFDKQWVKLWGENHVQRPLTGNGVIFEKNLTAIASQPKRENLTLHKTAKARTWSETGGLLGVRPELLEPPPAVARSTPGVKKPGVPNNTNPGLKL
ncbi:MAG: pknB 33 [Planctomycetaceae bacterium]|nr:pknB 33 [Planctomycetaceae bacterium]